jgi:hypothetical protein
LAAEELIKKAGRMWDRVYDSTYRDDITISALKVIVGDRSVAEDAKAEL